MCRQVIALLFYIQNSIFGILQKEKKNEGNEKERRKTSYIHANGTFGLKKSECSFLGLIWLLNFLMKT